MVLGKQVSDGGEVESGATAKPVEVTDNMAKVSLGFVEDALWKMWSWRYFVDRVTRTVWGARWGLRGEVKRSNDSIDQGLLREVYSKVVVWVLGGGDFVTKEVSGSMGEVN